MTMRYRDTILAPLGRIILEGGGLFLALFVIKSVLLKPVIALLPLSELAGKSLQGVVTICLIIAGYIAVVNLVEKRPVVELGLSRLGRDATMGLLGGLMAMSLVLITLWLAGAYTISTVAPSSGLLTGVIWIFLLALLEEILFRGVLYRVCEEHLGTLVALLVSALVFGGLHIFNDNANLVSVVSASLGGLFIGLFFTLTGRLWLPIFFHAGWNLAQTLGGIPLSGTEAFGRWLDSALAGPDWLTGGTFGPENSVVTLALCLAILLVCFRLARSRGLIRPLPRPVPRLEPKGPAS